MSFARRMRSISWSVLIARADASSGVASATSPNAGEPVAREGRRLADHSVRCLRAERELEPDAPVLRSQPRGHVEHARESEVADRSGRSPLKSLTSLVQAVRDASSSDASRQISTGSPSRGNTQAS